jgi:hypothetical protein
LRNGEKIRLSEEPAANGGVALVIERTDYLADLTTGQTTGVRFNDTHGHSFYNGHDFAFDSQGGTPLLKRCADSDCSNQIGASCLVVAVSVSGKGSEGRCHGHIFIVEQGEGNVQSSGLLAPSGSGSLDWSDFIEWGDCCIAEGMTRELMEETVKGDWRNLLDRGQRYVRFTGFGRMLHRGGKPEFYGLVIMPRSKGECGVDPTEMDFVSGHHAIAVSPLTAPELRRTLHDYALANQKRLSHPLFLSIAFADVYLANRGTQFDTIVAQVAKSAPAVQ